MNIKIEPIFEDHEYDNFLDDTCHHCGGDGWVAFEQGRLHKVVDCPCCGGSGKFEDCEWL